MLTVTDQLRIRQAYYHEKKSQREIARELGLSRNTVKKAIQQDEAFEYRRQQPERCQTCSFPHARGGEPEEYPYPLPAPGVFPTLVVPSQV